MSKILKEKAKEKVRLSVNISIECNDKFRSLVRLRHGLMQGALSFEVERAIRQYLGEKDLDVLVNDKEWHHFILTKGGLLPQHIFSN